jgi:hypothetical protein
MVWLLPAAFPRSGQCGMVSLAWLDNSDDMLLFSHTANGISDSTCAAPGSAKGYKTFLTAHKIGPGSVNLQARRTYILLALKS